MSKLIAVFVTGACLGSFFKLIVDRYGTKESFIFKLSYCNSCKKNLLWWQNIPVFGYLFLGGKCSFCKTKIDVYCLYAELITGFAALLLYVALVFKNQNVFEIAAMISFFMVLLLLSMFDFKHKIIPHEITYSAILIIVLCKVFFKVQIQESFVNLGVAFLFMDFMCLIAMLFKKDDQDENKISVSLMTWTILSFFINNIYFVLIPIVLYFVSINFQFSKKAYLFLRLSLFFLLLCYGFKTVYFDLDPASLELYFSGIGIIYFVCEVLFYFFQRFFIVPPHSSALSHESPVAIGGGDITVFALISVFLGYKISFLTLFIASFLGIISHFILKFTGRSVSFVPYLTLACFIIILIKK